MIIGQNHSDRCFLVLMEHHAHCSGPCGRLIRKGEFAWSYQVAPVDGNYVECGPCRYGHPILPEKKEGEPCGS